jgi:hypothetical protein
LASIADWPVNFFRGDEFMARMTRTSAVLVGGFTVAVLDITDAFIFFGIRSGTSPERILKGIAAGFLGKAASTGGVGTAVVGAFSHLLIATMIVFVYNVASARITVLARQPFVFGPIYGVVAYVVMNRVVIPLSAIATTPHPALPVLLNGLAIHIFGVGIPAALFARASTSQRP